MLPCENLNTIFRREKLGVWKSDRKSRGCSTLACEKQRYLFNSGDRVEDIATRSNPINRTAGPGDSGRMLVRGGRAVFPKKTGCAHRHSDAYPTWMQNYAIENRNMQFIFVWINSDVKHANKNWQQHHLYWETSKKSLRTILRNKLRITAYLFTSSHSLTKIYIY